MNLWKLLLAFLYLGVDPDPEDPPGDELGGVEDPPAGDEGSGGGEDPPAGDPPQESASDKRARLAEEQLAAERAENNRLRQASRPAPAQGETDEARDARELAEARARGATENDLYWVKFRQDMARQTRQATEDAKLARRESSDMADKADFNAIAAAKPQAFKTYAPKVEQVIEQMRRDGQDIPPRRVIMAMLIGKDALDGKLKGKTKEPGAEPAKVDRGRTPGVRTDVSARGARKTEHQARIERLRDKYI